jgi:hypothetical protein
MHRIIILMFILLLPGLPLWAQSPTATIDGRVLDPAKAVIDGATIHATNIDTNIQYATHTNSAGLFAIVNLPPGNYRIEVSKAGFRTIVNPGVVLHVQDVVALNFDLPVGSISESITVTGSATLVNTEDASVSTVVDRNLAENLPMNGRSFQTLIDLTPGVVLTSPSNGGIDSGQFSVNGQRAASNYWMVDGVSANVGGTVGLGGNQLSGAVGTSTVLGGTNSLVSIDAMQEFRIQTSTFAPEFGRTPGAQISIATRSGENRFHGAVFDYLRNDAFDASDWFNGYLNNPALPKAQERQNDFGGVFSGPIVRDRTFFFFSYEGLRLRLPETTLTQVPDLNARDNASADMKPFLNVFPLDPKQPDLGNGVAQFNASYSQPASLDAYSLRIDERLGQKMNIFGRYSYSPSESRERGASGTSLNTVFESRSTPQIATLGSTWAVSGHASNDFRINYSRTSSIGRVFEDGFGGGAPLQTLPLPAPFTASNARLIFAILSLGDHADIFAGTNMQFVQRQWNLVDNVSIQRGSHNLKLGVDYRRLSPQYNPFRYGQIAVSLDVPSAETGNLFLSILQVGIPTMFVFRNLGVFAQDSWHIVPRMTMTYGLRWDTDFVPASVAGPSFPGVTGFNLNNLSQLGLAPAGTPAFKTTFGNFAPRVGVAYQLSQRQNVGTVVRGGFGVFYDLATSEAANLILAGGYPFRATSRSRGGTFPLSPAAATPPSVEPPSVANPGDLAAFDPQLKLPYTLQWNASLEQGLGPQQTLTATYVGAMGRRLLQTTQVLSPNPSINEATLVSNTSTSDYHALQLQFQRSFQAGLRVLASYAWSHSIDVGSAGSVGNGSNIAPEGPNQRGNRGDSDFDIRNGFSAGVTYAVPALQSNLFVKTLTHGWSLNAFMIAHSAAPITVATQSFVLTNGSEPSIRPDVIPGIPLYLHGSQFPGGMAINNIPGAVSGGCADGSQSVGPFCLPPTDANGNALRQGNLGRNSLRGFGATQLDIAVHRDFRIHESLTLQFRAEAFNVLNHPNFGPPDAGVDSSQFGLSSQMLGQFLSGGSSGSGSLSPLYQIGGPRSMQFALKLSF